MKRTLRFLIAFGPTEEPMDPVRFISNNSTGTMGRHLIRAARQRGHKVTSIECPADARTARDLEKKLASLLPRHDVLVMAAAVCDVKPAFFAPAKIKKEKLSAMRFVRNPDILAGLAKKKRKNQIFIGFGLESTSLLQSGFKKLRQKGLEVIVLQKVTENRTPFGDKPVEAFVMGKEKNYKRYRSIAKRRLAQILVKEAERLSNHE